MQQVTDQTGRTLSVPDFPMRIISLVPSQTELLFDLGLGDRVVGITKFCVHPRVWFESKTRIGGTKIIRHGVIDALQPDLIIANKEENTEDDIARLSENYPVWVSDVRTLDSALDMICAIGQLTQTGPLAAGLNAEIRERFAQLIPAKSYRTLYLIWRKPFMAVGKNTFVDDMLMRCALVNCLESERYPELQPEDIRELNPEVVLLSSEPYPFKEQHIAEIKRLLPNADVQLVDGEPFSWYGSRILNSVSYFHRLLSLLS